jgi:hypothetical protein
MDQSSNANSLEGCKKRCHDADQKCNGIVYTPWTHGCSPQTTEDARPYIWNNPYPKFVAIPVNRKFTFGPGSLCPLPGSDNQVYDFGEKKHLFKLSCRNQFRSGVEDIRQLGPVDDVDYCGEQCGADKDCLGFHYYQPVFHGGRYDGARNCDLIMKILNGNWEPFYPAHQYLSGLKVKVRGESWLQAYRALLTL